MSDKKKSKKTAQAGQTPAGQAPEEPVRKEPIQEEPVQEAAAPEEPVQEASAPEERAPAEEEVQQAELARQEEKYLRLCAEYDNYRKRTAKEKEAAWSAAKGETVKSFLPVYDNLERALRQETGDEAYRKGVELTMQQLKKVLEELGVAEIPALGQVFDANLHCAVMHVEDPELGENTVKEVFQTGFKLGDTVIRYAMVAVAN